MDIIYHWINPATINNRMAKWLYKTLKKMGMLNSNESRVMKVSPSPNLSIFWNINPPIFYSEWWLKKFNVNC